MPAKKVIYQFKITLKDIKPPIWRRIQVPSTYTFWDLHSAIQDAMGWLDYHLHEFSIKDMNRNKLAFGTPTKSDDFTLPYHLLPGWKHKISKYINLSTPSFLYVYDFGDDWNHAIKLEKVLPVEEGVRYPRCIGGKRNSPPEDCGGTPGYERMLEVLADRENTEYESTREWVDSMKRGHFDPEEFTPSQVVFDDPQERFKSDFQQL